MIGKGKVVRQHTDNREDVTFAAMALPDRSLGCVEMLVRKRGTYDSLGSLDVAPSKQAALDWLHAYHLCETRAHIRERGNARLPPYLHATIPVLVESREFKRVHLL